MSVGDLKLEPTWVLQQDNDPKHTNSTTPGWLQNNTAKPMERPGHSPDLDPVEMVLQDLK